MEEIPSLESYGPESSARPESETSNPEECDSQENVEATDTPESPPAEERAPAESASKALPQDGDEDFDQISQGSLDMDESQSRDKSAPKDEQVTGPKSSDNPEAESLNTSNENMPEPEAQNEEQEHCNIDSSAEGAEQHDALGESVEDDDEQAAGDAVDGAPASMEAMDVDENEAEAGGDGEAEAEAEPTKDTEVASNIDDVEMRSEGGDSRCAAAEEDEAAGNDTVDKDNLSEGRDEVDRIDEPDTEASPDDNKDTQEDDDADPDGNADEDAEQADDTADAEQLDDTNEPEHGDDTVENVLEPEESDVCLIPDDPETEVTEAEKELARENAEKAAEEEEAAEQEQQQAAKSPNQELDMDDIPADNDKDVDASDEATAAGEKSPATSANAEPNDDDATELDATENEEPTTEEASNAAAEEAGAAAKTIISWIVGSTRTCQQCANEKVCGFRFKKLEAESSENVEAEADADADADADANAAATNTYQYICDQSCCDALLAEQPGKYFVRRKKFLVEELSQEEDRDTPSAEQESSSPTNADETSAEGDELDQSSTDKLNNCIQCKEQKKCKYFLRQEQDSFYICNDDCFNLLNAEEPEKYKLKRHSIRVRNIGATTIRSPSKKPECNVVARTIAEAETARLDRMESFHRRCADCQLELNVNDKQLIWETMDFCNEVCLGSYQRAFGSNCETCKEEVSSVALGKYCVRFGFEVRQFCCASCLNTYKKGLKTCSCCQKDISSGQEGFLAPVGDKDQFKDFCSQSCLRRYDNMCNPKKKLRTDMCGVCNNEKPVRVEMLLDDKEHYFCSNPCFSAFKFVSNVNADPCAMCSKYFERKSTDAYTIYSIDHQSPKMFCSRICINVYIIVNRHIVCCQWCKVKKYNFDMIYKLQGDQETLTCSINCLTMHAVSCNITARAVTKCDNCENTSTPQYHLTMSDGSMRNFCTYQCVMQFQNQFARTPLTLDSDIPSTSSSSSQQKQSASHSRASKNDAPFPTGLPKRVKLKLSQQTSSKNSAKKLGGMVPVISNVQSLASLDSGNLSVRRKRGRRPDSPPPLSMITQSTAPSGDVRGRGRPRKNVDYNVARTPSPTLNAQANRRSIGSDAPAAVTETKIITVPPYPKAVRNVNISCKPMMVSTGEQCTPVMVDCGMQTEKDYSNKVLIPVPVPIFVPQPMYMYSAPFPVPVPIPLPIPVPIFIPTTRNTAQGILKEIKKIQDKMPEDPLEAELLMMAEMVAEEKHDSDSDSDNEIKPDPGLVNLHYQNSLDQQQQQQQQVVDVSGSSHNPYGDDMLQIALKMATGDYDNHHQTGTVDLESSMTANTISNQSPMGHDMAQMGVHHLDQQHHMLDASQRAPRGRKRTGGSIGAVLDSPSRNSRSPVKRPRGNEMDHSALQQQSQQALQPQEKPDAQMFLKYTFGVNAWKQWVMTKNADIEKSSMRRRPFKTELLQMTADELNYSLCLFVKEVRKPNGTEYAPDTIYYLVLGIQQYLYVNGRIDNIFYDPYYERFTECLDEVARKFSVLYNDSQYIVTRVEEEHLWECKQLGAHSPHVLLSTLMFFNTKHFNLTTVEEHMQLSFSHIMKHWKRSSQNSKVPGTRNVLLRFYPPQAGLDANPRKKKVYEQQENEENPLRCPVRLYEFYLSKCPESVKTRNDVFYLQPERSCVPDSPVWYSTQALSQDALQRMLHRVKMVKEINIALLTT
ncbi:woc [Drosophila busckii]|uniref:Woc n=1 Tax=Drosophila busckii TaxID=30019 RepID=A0A0M3QY90_DROBS|nr:zinc finger MYM-type protein 4 [Drosophila busckii]ALC47263.1 woc [Drosophila busckii]